MGWSGRAPAPPVSEACPRGAKVKEHAMSQQLSTTIAVIGVDIGKNSFHVVGLDQRGAIVLRQKWSRGQVERWSIRQLCCSGVLVSTNRIFALVTASQIASASAASFFCRLTYG